MITFYPENLEIWKDEFDFHPSITLTPKEKLIIKIFMIVMNLLGFVNLMGLF